MKTKLFILAVVACLFVSVQTKAQLSITSNAKAEIVPQMTIVDNSGLAGGTTLDFGQMTISPTLGGTCILSTANSRTATGGVTYVNSSTPTLASFGVTGKAGLTYVITLPATDVTITRAGGSETMTIGTFLALPASSSTGNKLTGTFNASGTDSFVVGGTLAVDAAEVEGVYSGTFSVSVAYN